MAVISLAPMGKAGKMTPIEKKTAMQIMARLSKYPCAKIFLEPVDPNLFPGYYDVVVEPVDISMINHRLKSQDYHTCSEWKHDMKQICVNAGAFFGPGSAQELLANRLYRLFEKQYEKYIGNLSVTKWVRTSFFLAYKVHFLSQKMPEDMIPISTAVTNLSFGTCKSILQELIAEQPVPEIAEVFEETRKVLTDGGCVDLPRKSQIKKEAPSVCVDNLLEKKQEKSTRKKSPTRKSVVRRYDVPKYTETEMEGLVCALSLLPDPDDVKEVARIVIRSQPELRLKMPSPKIAIESLTTNTVKQLMDFAKRRFRELRLEFPTQSIVL